MLKNLARNADIQRLATEACEHVFAHIPFRGEAEPLSVCDAAYISSIVFCVCVFMSACPSSFLGSQLSLPFFPLLFVGPLSILFKKELLYPAERWH